MDCWAPAWSADGAKLAYFSQRALDGSDTMSSNPHNIWIVRVDGSSDVPLTQLTAYNADSYYPQWSPDSTELAFYSSRALDGSNAANGSQPYTWNIWVARADGSSAIPITRQSNNFSDSQDILWSKNGGTLLFTTANNIWTAHPDGSTLTQLTTLSSALNFLAGWSPDGSKLTFNSTRALGGSNNAQNKENLWVMNADGSSPTPLTRLTVIGASGGMWSPDGTRIAYFSPRAFDGSNNSNSGDVFNIWMVNSDGSGDSPLTKLSMAISVTPQWQP